VESLEQGIRRWRVEGESDERVPANGSEKTFDQSPNHDPADDPEGDHDHDHDQTSRGESR